MDSGSHLPNTTVVPFLVLRCGPLIGIASPKTSGTSNVTHTFLGWILGSLRQSTVLFWIYVS